MNKHLLKLLLRKSLLLIVFLILSACNVSPDEDSYIITINLEDNKEILLDDVFSNKSIIQLETTEESLIGDIFKTEYYNGKFYVMDVIQRAILCFDSEGNFKFKLAAQGHGPGEYQGFSDFTIDRYNKNLVLISGMTQEIIFYDLYGNFLKKMKIGLDSPMGINWVYSIDKSTLLLTSLNFHQLLFYCMEKEQIINKKIQVPPYNNIQITSPLFPNQFNVYQFKEDTYVMPYLKRTIKNISKIKQKKHLKFCFGKYNNSSSQIENFHLAATDLKPPQNLYIYDIVGKNKYLNYHIIKVNESERFVLAIVAYKDSIKHILFDKKEKESYVFNKFKEGVVINFLKSNIIENNKLVTFYSKKNLKRNQSKVLQHYDYFNGKDFDYKSLSPKDRKIVDNHCFETDNPFLIIYEFKL